MVRAREAVGKGSKKRDEETRRKEKVKGVHRKSKKAFKAKRTTKKFSGAAKKLKNGVKAKTNKEKTSIPVRASKDEGSGKKCKPEVPAPAPAPKKRKIISTDNSRVHKKARLIHRKSQGGGEKGYELVRESKIIWEHLRQHNNRPSRTLALEEMMSMAKGHFKELALKHDTARVVQSCLKSGTPEDRSSILAELKDNIVELCKVKYAKYVVKALLRYCTSEERGQVIHCLYGNVHKLTRHAEASEIVEFAYNEYANKSQRTALVQEFYGSEFAVFKNPTSSSSSSQPEDLGELLAKHADKAKSILLHMRDSLLPLLDKVVVRHSIVHKALLDYLQHCSTEARTELIECAREQLPSVLHTKDGSRLAMICVWHGTTKDRKVIIKSLKGLVCKVCQEENGYLVMMALFDCVDDTVLLRKAILSELILGLEKVCSSHYGRRVLLYLLAPRSPRHFTRPFVQLLSPGDGNAHSKKPTDVRRRELLEVVAPAVLSLATTHVVEWIQSKTHAPLLLEVILSLPGDLCTLHQQLLEALCGEGGVALMNDVHTDWLLARLLTTKDRSSDRGQGFIHLLLTTADAEGIRSWVQGSYRMSYLLCRVLNEDGDEWKCVRDKVTKALLSLDWDDLMNSSCKAHQTLGKKLLC